MTETKPLPQWFEELALDTARRLETAYNDMSVETAFNNSAVYDSGARAEMERQEDELADTHTEAWSVWKQARLDVYNALEMLRHILGDQRFNDKYRLEKR